jgi:hypothetical protein
MEPPAETATGLKECLFKLLPRLGNREQLLPIVPSVQDVMEGSR